MVVGLAVGPSITLEEIPRAELLVAVSAGEVLGVPRPPQRGDDLHRTVRKHVFLYTVSLGFHYNPILGEFQVDQHLSDDGFFASVAASLLRGLYSLAAHVCPERSEHMLERGGFWLPRAAAVLLLPRALLTVHVSSCLAACSCAAHLHG